MSNNKKFIQDIHLTRYNYLTLINFSFSSQKLKSYPTNFYKNYNQTAKLEIRSIEKHLNYPFLFGTRFFHLHTDQFE